jgi:hypothetical protein
LKFSFPRFVFLILLRALRFAEARLGMLLSGHLAAQIALIVVAGFPWARRSFAYHRPKTKENG